MRGRTFVALMINPKKINNHSEGSRQAVKKNGNRGCEIWRISMLVFFVFIIIAIIVCRLYSLQIASYESFKLLADGQHTLFKELIPERGEIFMKDKDGLYPAAVNRATKMVYAVPKEMENYKDTAEKIADALQLDKEELAEKFNKPDDMYEVVKHKLSDEEINKLNEIKLKGIHLAEESYRFYPSGELAASILGFVGWKDKIFGGRYGIEAYFENELKGEEGRVTHDREASGKFISIGANDLKHAKNGDDIILTIDHTVQYETERILKGAILKNDADSGSIIVMDPQTGKILAMATAPTFNPNEYAQVEDINVYRNSSVSDAYESGSVFKPITMAAGLDSKAVNPETTYTDSGAVKEAGYTIKNSDLKSNGLQTMTQVLEKSLNTGVIFVEKTLGNKNFADYVKRFGFGEPTGLELISEGNGNINNLKNLKSNIQFFTAAFGQGISVTPIQLITAYSAIANGGLLMKPQIIDKIIYADGSENQKSPQEVRRVISQQAAAQLGQMLRSVVVIGHGKRADVPGYLVAGKTGTAQVANTDSRGYTEGINIGSFAGFAPLNNPRFAILVRMDNPRNVEWAESSAAPAFGELMKFLLDYYKVEPTEEYDQAKLDSFNATHDLRSFLMMKKAEEEKVKAKAKAKEDLPAGGENKKNI